MSFRQYNSTSRLSNNLFRQRSLTGSHSKQLSVMNIISERQSLLLKQKRIREQEDTSILQRETQISKLRKNLESVMTSAVQDRLQNSKAKEQIMSYHHLKNHLQSKLKNYQQALKEEQKKTQSVQELNTVLKQTVESLKTGKAQVQLQLERKEKEMEQLKKAGEQIQQLRKEIRDLLPLKNRIYVLEEQIRHEKLQAKKIQGQFNALHKEREELLEKIANTKPREQQLRERVAYFERVNLDLERKMEDFNRRENDYIKQTTNYKLSLNKMTEERNQFRTAYEDTSQRLSIKAQECVELTIATQNRDKDIAQLKDQLSGERQQVSSLRVQLEQKVLFFKQQGEENIVLNAKNKLLQEQQHELRRTIEAYLRVSDQVNLTIVQRTEEIRKQKDVIAELKSQLQNLQKRFEQFDKLLEEGSNKSTMQIRESFYSIIRQNNEIRVKVKDLSNQLEEKALLFGEERDAVNRKEALYIPPPTDQTQYLAIFYQKTEELMLLQSSNDQLIKVKKDLEREIEELNARVEQERKDMVTLKLKTADLFRAKKELDEARSKMQRYQQALEEDRQVIQDIKGQLGVLRAKNIELNDRHFMIELQKKNLEVTIQQQKEMMKELNVQTLQTAKAANQKNAHLVIDSIRKMTSAIKSLQFYFNCAFCGEAPLTPVTLAPCGHTYCNKCKDAYAQFCYECDNGLPIDRIFNNKYLKDAAGKYRFLTMIVSEVEASFIQKQ